MALDRKRTKRAIHRILDAISSLSTTEHSPTSEIPPTYAICGHFEGSCDCEINGKRRLIIEMFDILCSLEGVELLRSNDRLLRIIREKMDELHEDQYLKEHMEHAYTKLGTML